MKKKEQVYINFRNAVLIIGLTVVTFAISMVLTFPFAASPMMLAFFSAPFATVLGGAIYVLMMCKAPYRGNITLQTFIKSAPMVLMGSATYTIVSLVSAIFAELVFVKDSTRTPLKMYISYGILSVGSTLGTYVPVLLQKDSIINGLVEQGVDAAIIAAYTDLYSPPYIALAGVVAFAAGCLGIFIGTKIFKKHFSKIGV